MPDYVGHCTVQVTDEELGITFPLLVFYPTLTPAKPESIGPYPMEVARDAPVKAGQFPAARVHPDFPPSQDPPGFDRARFHEEMNAEIAGFLARHL